jgi:hypothetical protein
MRKRQRVTNWFARLAIGFVFVVNLNCALAFILTPERYAPGFEISGVAGCGLSFPPDTLP